MFQLFATSRFHQRTVTAPKLDNLRFLAKHFRATGYKLRIWDCIAKRFVTIH